MVFTVEFLSQTANGQQRIESQSKANVDLERSLSQQLNDLSSKDLPKFNDLNSKGIPESLRAKNVETATTLQEISHYVTDAMHYICSALMQYREELSKDLNSLQESIEQADKKDQEHYVKRRDFENVRIYYFCRNIYLLTFFP